MKRRLDKSEEKMTRRNLKKQEDVLARLKEYLEISKIKKDKFIPYNREIQDKENKSKLKALKNKKDKRPYELLKINIERVVPYERREDDLKIGNEIELTKNKIEEVESVIKSTKRQLRDGIELKEEGKYVG